ncbi:MAG TPA: 6-phosphogluconolactonase [Gemmatimonadaceae bacterium]
MSGARVRVLPSAAAIGDYLAPRLLEGIKRAENGGKRFLLGCPTGRTPRPIYESIARRLTQKEQDMSGVTLVMMDEYLVREGAAFRYADDRRPWSCHHFARTHIVDAWNQGLKPDDRLRSESVWFPDPAAPAEYDGRIADAGGIDFFILASGASDGHVAFNPPGSPRGSTTRIIALSDETRRDNLKTFPDFGALDAVPTHGVSVGLATIASAKECAMVVWGAGKRLSLQRMQRTDRFEPDWPATIIHECRGEIICDAAVAEESAA